LHYWCHARPPYLESYFLLALRCLSISWCVQSRLSFVIWVVRMRVKVIGKKKQINKWEFLT
jgi:hypothetical protein